jgi:hypothetical protein
MNSDPIKQWYIEHHICYVCRRENAEPNKQMCWECAEKSRVFQRKKYHQNRAANIADSSQRRRERKAKRLELGLCVECGKRPHDEGHKTRIYCRRKELRLQKERRQQKGALPSELRGDGTYCYACCQPKCNGTKICGDCIESLRARAANARAHVDLSAHKWTAEKRTDIARIKYEHKK